MGIPPAPRGQPQIEVTFEVDANGILQVSAVEKGSGKSEKIQINNDTGRLSKEEIDRMVREAEEFAEEDKIAKERIDSKNTFENYIFSVRNQVTDPEKLGKKLSDEDKATVNEAIKEAEEWLKGHPDAGKEELDEKYKALEAKCNPIISKGGAGAQPGAQQQGGQPEEEYDTTSEL
jgi:heat shock protein 5